MDEMGIKLVIIEVAGVFGTTDGDTWGTVGRTLVITELGMTPELLPDWALAAELDAVARSLRART